MHHLIFEGAELAGKSWLMSQIYDYLEPKYNQSKNILDGCHWFNCDNGVFGEKESQGVIDGYLKIFSSLKNKNLIVEKFFLSDKIYHRLYNNKEINYRAVEDELDKLNFKIILITFPEDEEIIQKRLSDRLNLYPHYKKIMKKPSWYIDQQREYKKEIKKTKLPFLEINTDSLPDNKPVEDILKWIKE